MNKINTIIYGGAFNPPTIAHEQILQACIDYSKKINAEIWIMPSGDRDDKKISNSKDKRLELINAMIKDIDNFNSIIKVFTYEIDKEVINHTIDTIKQLANMYPNRSFFWVFGYDSTETMINWDGGQWMLDNLKMIIIKRKGCKLSPLVKNFVVLDAITTEISSTEVRQKIENGEKVDGFVGENVKKYLAV